MKYLDDVDFNGKRVFLRVDFNVPLDKNRQVTDDTRIQAILPSLRKIVGAGGKLVLASHLGRPKGKVVAAMSLAARSRSSGSHPGAAGATAPRLCGCGSDPTGCATARRGSVIAGKPAVSCR